MKNLILSFIIISSFLSCRNPGEITAAQAHNLVEDYMDKNPVYETASFNTRELRLQSDKDAALTEAIQELETEGYVEIADARSRKKWFSKDSVMMIKPVLTRKALPYIVAQKKNNTEVKTIIYDLDDSRDIIFNKKTDKSATFNAILIKIKTPFYSFGNDSQPNSDFITKNFKAKYFEEKGWILVN